MSGAVERKRKGAAVDWRNERAEKRQRNRRKKRNERPYSMAAH